MAQKKQVTKTVSHAQEPTREASGKMVKVKILAFIGEWSPGDEVEVSEELSKSLTAAPQNDIHGHFKHQPKAILLSVAEKMKTQPMNIKKMTMKDLADMNAKNIVPTPHDPAFEAKVKAIQNGEKVSRMPGLSAPRAEEENQSEYHGEENSEEESKSDHENSNEESSENTEE
jgi:hypothetical protein